MSETCITSVADDAFNGCTKLASVSLPSTTEELGANAFSGCRKLQTLSITAATPPTAQSTTFKSVPNETCSLLIPTSAFGDYLLASYWGSFVDIKASFDIEIEDEVAELAYEVFDSVDEANDGVTDNSSSNNGLSVRRNSPSRTKSASNGLSDGISLFVNSAKTVRFKIAANGANKTQVLLNNVDITDRVVNGYLVLSNFADVNTLKIKDSTSAVKDITADDTIDAGTVVDIYNLLGVQVLRGVEMGSVSDLTPGIYIVRSANAAKKIVIK
jgi:hypothetical protein